MTKENKQLLLKDLCARLTYGVICHYDCVIPIERREFHKANCKGILKGIVPMSNGHIGFMVDSDKVDALEGNIKPYLRPMSSMTKKEKKEIDASFSPIGQELFSLPYVDWLLAHHFDYRGLIPIGLALEAPEGMYKTE